jgi:hypothetical protein
MSIQDMDIPEIDIAIAAAELGSVYLLPPMRVGPTSRPVPSRSWRSAYQVAILVAIQLRTAVAKHQDLNIFCRCQRYSSGAFHRP